jgi:hypothetical protein
VLVEAADDDPVRAENYVDPRCVGLPLRTAGGAGRAAGIRHPLGEDLTPGAEHVPDEWAGRAR